MPIQFTYLGPKKRPTSWQYCICKMGFTTYWAHRQTRQHKEAVKSWRKEAR